MERQDFSRTYLAHHELESDLITIFIITSCSLLISYREPRRISLLGFSLIDAVRRSLCVSICSLLIILPTSVQLDHQVRRMHASE